MDDIDWDQVFSWAAEMREQPPRPEVREKIRKHEHYVKTARRFCNGSANATGSIATRSAPSRRLTGNR